MNDEEIYSLDLNSLNFECEDFDNRELFWEIKRKCKPLGLHFIKECDDIYKEMITGRLFIRDNEQFVNEELALWFSKYSLLQKNLNNIKDFKNIANYYISVMLLAEETPNKIEFFFENIEKLQEKDIEYKSKMNALVLKKGMSLIN